MLRVMMMMFVAEDNIAIGIMMTMADQNRSVADGGEPLKINPVNDYSYSYFICGQEATLVLSSQFSSPLRPW